MRHRASGDHGASAVEMAVLASVMALLFLLVVQAGVYFHARAAATTAARLGADQARVCNGSGEAGHATATEFLAQAAGGLEVESVSVNRDVATGQVVVTVSGTTAEVFPGLGIPISVTVSAPIEVIAP